MTKHEMRRKVMRQLIHTGGREYVFGTDSLSQRFNEQHHTHVVHDGITQITGDRICAVFFSNALEIALYSCIGLIPTDFNPVTVDPFYRFPQPAGVSMQSR